jgi:hypothetical protein
MLSVRLSVCLIASALLLAPTTVAAAQRSDFGTLSIQVRPPDAEILIDGERWNGSEITGALVIQLPPGVHRVDLRSPGRRTYSTEITILAGEMTPLNVALQGAPTRAPEPSPPPPAPPPSGGIMRSVSEDGFVIAPDFRVSDIGHETAALVGAYGGYVFGGQLLLGGGGYWQANTTSGVHLAYGGPVVEWRMFPGRTIGFNLHGLVGAGTLYADHGYYRYGPNDGRRPVGRAVPNYYSGSYSGYGDTFFVAEPEAQIVVRFGTSVRVQGGVGYRTTSENALSGASGSVSVQFGR